MNSLYSKVPLIDSLRKDYNDIRRLRNSFAHPAKVNGAVDADKSVDTLKEKIKGIISIYKNNYFSSSEKALQNRESLKIELEKTQVY